MDVQASKHFLLQGGLTPWPGATVPCWGLRLQTPYRGSACCSPHIFRPVDAPVSAWRRSVQVCVCVCFVALFARGHLLCRRRDIYAWTRRPPRSSAQIQALRGRTGRRRLSRLRQAAPPTSDTGSWCSRWVWSSRRRPPPATVKVSGWCDYRLVGVPDALAHFAAAGTMKLHAANASWSGCSPATSRPVRKEILFAALLLYSFLFTNEW